jgi:hypothetical protein
LATSAFFSSARQYLQRNRRPAPSIVLIDSPVS